jgi:hypothetical protein
MAWSLLGGCSGCLCGDRLDPRLELVEKLGVSVLQLAARPVQGLAVAQCRRVAPGPVPGPRLVLAVLEAAGERPSGLGVATGLEVGAAEPRPRNAVVGPPEDSRLQDVDGVGRAPLLEQALAERRPQAGLVGVEAQRGLERLPRSAVVAHGHMRPAEIGEGNRRLRVEPQRLLQVQDGLTGDAEPPQGPAQQDAHARHVRRELDGPASSRQRALRVAGIQARDAEPEPVHGRVGAEADRLLEGRPRELVRVGLPVRAPQGRPGRAGGRVGVDGLLFAHPCHPARDTLTRDVRVIRAAQIFRFAAALIGAW